MKKFSKYQLPAILWMMIIFTLSSIHKFPEIKFLIAPDKVAHVTVFFILCLLCRRAFYFQNKISWLKNHSLMLAFLFTCFYGYSDEFHQRFVPGRTYDLYDFAADATGALLFVLLQWWIRSRKRTAELTRESI